MKKRILAYVGAGALAAAMAVFAATTVLAQTPTPGNPAQSFLAKVAKNLGIDQPRLEAAFKKAELDTVDEQQQAGKLTPEQAQQAKDRINQGQGGFPFGGPGHPGPMGMGGRPGGMFSG